MKNRHTSISAAIRLSIAVVLVTAMSLPFSAMALTLSRQLQVGMRGSDVAELQTYLASDPSIYPQGLVTGYYGPLTRAAVMRLQARHGISQVGRVGPQTMALINSISGTSDTQAPVISNVQVSAASSSATVSWNTNEGTADVIYYGTLPLTLIEGSATNDVTISGASTILHTDMRTSHSITLTNLMPNTTYNYVVYVRDASGNVTVSLPATLRTN